MGRRLNSITTWWLRWRRSLLRPVLHVAVFLALVIGGYFLTYQLFFLELRLEDMTRVTVNEHPETFRYDGVAYFEGNRVFVDQPITYAFSSVRVLDRAEGKSLELFIRVDDIAELPDELLSPGVLEVMSLPGHGEREVSRVTLSREVQQRIQVPWVTNHHGTNRVRITFVPSAAEAIDSVVVSTTIRGVNYWALTGFLFLIAAVLLAISLWSNGWENLPFALAAGCVLSLMAFIHAGAFISTEYFTFAGDAIVRVSRLAQDGIINEQMYRGVGYLFLPWVMTTIEGEDATFSMRYFLNTFPTIRYCMFVWLGISIVILMRAVAKHMGMALSVVLGVLVVCYYPFIIDCYNMDDDSYAIPLMMGFTACVIRYVMDPPKRRVWIACLGLLLFFMTTVKVTPAALMVLVPLSLLVSRASAGRASRRAWWIGILCVSAVLLVSVVAGRSVATMKTRYVTPTEPYSKGVFWEMLWAANGLYDHHSAHWFTKSGGLRSERVAERTTLAERPSHLRHSQRAADEVYRPDVLRAIRNRPGFFYSTAFFRFHTHALSFFRYTWAAYARWEPWLDDGFVHNADGSLKTENISGEDVYVVTHERNLIRHGRMWKISPLVLLTKIVQTMSIHFDLLLLVCALVGGFLLRRREFAAFVVLCAAARFAAGAGVHAVPRYVDFFNVALLLGLAGFIVTAWQGLRRVAATTLPLQTVDVDEPAP